MRRIKYYIKIWWLMNIKYILPVFSHSWTFIVYLLGKIIRFTFFFLFIVFLLKGTKTFAGYNLNEVLFFYLSFNLIDITAQFLFREVYNFRPKLVTGSFDYVLLKPMNPLFKVLLGGADAIDLIILPPLIILLVYFGIQLNPSLIQVIVYVLLIINSLVITSAFHIAVAAMGIITMEIDHTIMIYRDLVSLGRFPVDIYKNPLQWVITYLVPVGVMMTLPVKALLGIAGFRLIVVSFAIGIASLIFANRLWKYALTKYTGAGS